MEKSNNVWMKWKSYPALPRVILVPLTYLLSNMFHQWQLENIWSQSSTTFNCSKPNLIDSPENSYLLKASSIRSWFFRLLNFLWFHPRFHLFPQREFENVITRDQLVLHTHASKKQSSAGRCQHFSSAILCSTISCHNQQQDLFVQQSLVNNLLHFVCNLIHNPSTCSLCEFIELRILQNKLYSCQYNTLFKYISFEKVFCRLFQSIWMLSTFKSSQKTAVECKTFSLSQLVGLK